tara:strand:+ start:836 stop:1087 length:252 start_codon:yes stop_codon:yes gene_type:complete
MIHDIVFHGNGGFDYHTIYNMPNWLRKFTFKEIQDHFNKVNDQQKSSQKNTKGQTSLVDADGKINTPNFKKVSDPYKSKTSYK